MCGHVEGSSSSLQPPSAAEQHRREAMSAASARIEARRIDVTQAIYTHTFDNGLVLLAESMDWLESVAFTLQLRAGYVYDPVPQQGLANFACEMVQRGCGSRNSRQFVEDLDRLGADRSASVSAAHTSFGATLLTEKLDATLDIYADLVRRPHLPAEQLDEGRQVCFQEILAAEDDLIHKTMVRLRIAIRPTLGTRIARHVRIGGIDITSGHSAARSGDLPAGGGHPERRWQDRLASAARRRRGPLW